MILHDKAYVECQNINEQSDHYLHANDKWIPVIQMQDVVVMSEDDFWEYLKLGMASERAGESFDELKKTIQSEGVA